MLTLALVTCGPQLEVALSGGPLRAPSVVRLAGVSARSTLVLAAVDLVFEDAGVGRESLERIVVTRGPGSFTGIRAGLATVSGLAAGTGAEACAYDSLTALAARAGGGGTVWAAQPGRRGEVYARPFRVTDERPPAAEAPLRIVAVADLEKEGPWVAAESLDLGTARRAVTARTTAEALLCLHAWGAEPQPLEPLYVEGPPIHRAGK